MINTKNIFIAITHIAAFIVLVFLGTWQLKRLNWKQDVVKNYHNNINYPPILIPDNININQNEFRNFYLSGSFDDNKTLFMYSKQNEKIGYEVYTVFITDKNKHIIVNRGWVPVELKDHLNKKFVSEHFIEGMVIKNSKKNFLIPKNDYINKIITHLDIKEASKLFNIDIEEYYLIQKNPKNMVSSPKIINPNFHNFHLTYAIIWFVLAIIDIVFFIIALKLPLFKLSSKKN